MDNPLTKTDLTNIKEALYQLNGVQQYIDLLEKLGSDTSEMKRKAEFLQGVLSTLRSELFPNKP